MRALLLACLLLVACSKAPASKPDATSDDDPSLPPSKVAFAPKRAPDESFQVANGPNTQRVLVWKCDASNERRAMVQSCVDATCGPWKSGITLCGGTPADREATRTSVERKELETLPRSPIPEGQGWR